MFDLLQHYKVITLSKPVAVVANGNSTAVEVDAGIGDDMLAIMQLGAAGAGASDKADVIIEGSPDNSTFATVATFSQVLGNNAGGIAAVGFKRGVNRFFREKHTITNGSAPTFVIGVSLLARSVQNSTSLNSAAVS